MPIGQEISSVKRGLPPAHYTLEIKKYSQLSKAVADRYESAIFKTKNESQECNWRIVICPMGDDKDDKAKGNYLSFYIRLQGSDDIFQSKRKLFAEYKMRVLDHPRIRIDEQRSGCWFSSEMRESGYPCFMSLDDLHKGGYLYGDTLIVEVEFLIVSVVKDQK
ncbi:hypothetical protein WN944_006248 [Citrus x changshan-huyou]|uniref:MATH domain-containing protein n=1 Tax=Citrus x changshan-huyou TaxID=2935761 RepID=A0AAP0QTC0_9ROSI